jgi:hypothetical protein
MSIGLTDSIAPLGEFPLIEDKDTKGGMRSVANITARDAILVNSRKAGMLVWTQEEDITWQLAVDLVTWNPFGGGGPTFDITSFQKTNPDGATLIYRKGSSINSITALAVYVNGPPLSGSVINSFGGSTDVRDIDPGVWSHTGFTNWSLAGTVARFGTDLQPDPTMTATLTATKGVTKQSAFTIIWTSDVWWGVGPAGLHTEEEIINLSGTALATSRIRTFTVSPSNQKVYYSYPKAYGKAIIYLNGFLADFQTPSEEGIQLTNINDVTQTYYIYESTNLLTGTNLAFVVT